VAQKTKNKSQDHCSFCNRDRADVKLLLQGIDGSICESCADQAMRYVEEELGQHKKINQKNTFHLPDTMNPRSIKTFLDGYVIGQDEAKKIMSVAVYNHYKRLSDGVDMDVEIEKSNVLFIGPTGTGKTLMAKTLAKLLEVPFAIVDATSFTEAGYVGEDVEGMLSRLLQACDYDIPKAELGIIYIDEIDKISRRGENPSITRDVSGEGVQQAMLKILEGAEVNVPPAGGRKHPEQQFLKLNTTNILFICGGAFDGLEKIIARRINTNVIGYQNQDSDKVDKENIISKVNHHDLKKFGLIPELLGRLPVLAFLKTLDRQAFIDILTLPKNAILKQYKKLFALDGVDLVVTKDALEYIADLALENKLGARGLRTICEKILQNAMFELSKSDDKNELMVTKEYIQLQISPGIS
jgi:ATP-dependent Clp protease ATP-binding subunit ClpX